MDLESPFYVRRKTDDWAESLVAKSGGITCTIKGPRQIGKSSLLVRTLNRAAQAGKRVVMLDFQTFDSGCVATPTNFYKAFLAGISRPLGIRADVERHWRRPLGNNDLCTDFLKEHILPVAKPGLVLGMDEADRICECDFSRDFFAMLRAWHNRRAIGFASQLDLVLVTSTEPYLFIQNLDQSPFNVGDVLALQDFTPREASTLNLMHGSPLDSLLEAKFYELLAGHPYLTHLTLYHVASRLAEPEQLLDESCWESGPFGDHLRRFLFHLSDNADLCKALKQVLAKGKCDNKSFHRLNGMGLVSGSAAKARLRCDLYRRYYSQHLED